MPTETGETMTITDEQIETLSDEADAAGDATTVALCAVALATGLGETAEIEPAQRATLERLGVIPEHVGADVAAREILTRQIAAARAMEGT